MNKRMAAKRGLVEMSELLLSAGVETNIKDKHGNTVFDMPLPDKMTGIFMHRRGKDGN